MGVSPRGVGTFANPQPLALSPRPSPNLGGGEPPSFPLAQHWERGPGGEGGMPPPKPAHSYGVSPQPPNPHRGGLAAPIREYAILEPMAKLSLDEVPGFARDAIARVLIPSEELRARVADLGAAISRDYAGLDPVLVGVLKGSAPFIADLLRALSIHVTVDFIAVSSYGPQTRTSGVVRILKDLDTNVAGRHVLVMEDIVDTGLTLSYILRSLQSREPASLTVGTLLDKSARRLVEVPLKYRGFEIPDAFVIGYGLDYQERYRNLAFVAVLKDDAVR
jgi:hypoxanthine phosphoribosyltransferase